MKVEPSKCTGRGAKAHRVSALSAAVILFSLPAFTRAESNADVLNTWLSAFDTGGAGALKEFQKRYRGNQNIAFALDTRDETGGFDLIRVETNTPTELTALLRQRNYPSMWRITMSRASADALPFKKFSYLPVPTTQPDAIAALNAFAGRLAHADRFSGVIAVSHRGKRVFAKPFGLANRITKQRVTLRTPFLIASQGKMFTAVSVLQLLEAGRIKLDDPIGRYLTDYPNTEVAQKVTIRELLTHEAGMGDMDLLQPQFAANRSAVHSIEDIIELNGNRPPAFEPGTHFQYSNYGYVLLGAIVARISGQSYYDYVADHIFAPAHMRTTAFTLRDQMARDARPYTGLRGAIRDVSDELPWRGTPAGGAVSTADDMIHFTSALNAGTLISHAMLEEATRDQTASTDLTAQGYGYGFIASQVDDFPYWGHGGDAPGQSLVLDYYPKSDTTFVCMSNRDPPVCIRLAFNFLFRSRAGTK